MAEVAQSPNSFNNNVGAMNNRTVPGWQKSANEAPPNSNVIVNYLPGSYTDEDLFNLFSPHGSILHYKIVKNLETLRSMGYGFVQFADPESAQKAIQSLNGMPVLNKQIKVSIARPASAEIKRSNLYIMGIPLTWTKNELINLFSPYGDVVESRILLDSSTRQSRGVGFCRLGSNTAALRAIDALNGTIPNGGTTKLTIKIADNPNHIRRNTHNVNMNPHPMHQLQSQPLSPQSQAHLMPGSYPVLKHVDYRYNQSNFPYQHAMIHQQSHFPQQHHYNKNNVNGLHGINPMGTMNGLNLPMAVGSPSMPDIHAVGTSFAPDSQCLFVYYLPLDMTDQGLYELFSQYVPVISTKVMKDQPSGRSRGYGFVNVPTYQDGLNAIQHLNGHKLGAKSIKVSFKSNKNNAPMDQIQAL